MGWQLRNDEPEFTIWERVVATIKTIVAIPILAVAWVALQLLGLLARLKGY